MTLEERIEIEKLEEEAFEHYGITPHEKWGGEIVLFTEPEKLRESILFMFTVVKREEKARIIIDHDPAYKASMIQIYTDPDYEDVPDGEERNRMTIDEAVDAATIDKIYRHYKVHSGQIHTKLYGNSADLRERIIGLFGHFKTEEKMRVVIDYDPDYVAFLMRVY